MLTGIHQFLTRCVAGDAVSTHAMHLQAWFSKFADARLYVEHDHDLVTGGARPASEYRPGPADVVVLHVSIHTPLAEVFAAAPGRKVIDFHNFTPARFYAEWDRPVAGLLERTADQLAQLAPIVDLALADSTFNADELRAVGYLDPRVVPIMTDLDAFDGATDAEVAAALTADRERGGARWLFVGRVCPNKGQHHLVRALALYRRHVDPGARLWLVGTDFTPTYTEALRRLARALDVDDAIDITGSVPFGALVAYYRAADVFVSASEHEGFGVPLLEAMYCGLPVVAHGVTAVPETVGDAALLVDSVDPGELAAAAGAVLRDGALRDELVARGARRVEHFAPGVVEDVVRDTLDPVLTRWAAA
ncbi:MAG TPA: glycosyltransferase family 4 protein [Acidimicrobiia bacterium]|nr:glycosyltransferase family 4 protein [Acidimicrobiia bacterium]